MDNNTMVDNPRKLLSELFPESPDDNTSTVAKRPIGDIDTSRKRRTLQKIALTGESKRKRWTVSSTILPGERPHVYFVDPADQKKNEDLLSNVEQGKYVLMHGTHASGKSTRTWRVMEQLQESGYFCLYITLTGVNLGADKEKFWRSFGSAFENAICDSLDIDATVLDIRTSDDFVNICLRQNPLWKLLAEKRNEQGQPMLRDGQFVVIFIDEFDSLVHVANPSICDSLLRVIHAIKTSGDMYTVQSVLGIGTFNILTLSTDSRALSPFNISDAFTNPNFTSEQVATLFEEFAAEHKVEILADVIEDICLNTNGHAGLVSLCGRAIHSLVKEKAYDLHGRLPYSRWKVFSGGLLGERIAGHRTFMLKSLSAESSRKTSNLLRERFLGFQGCVKLANADDVMLANCLVGEGVLTRVDSQTKTYRMSSPFVDSIIRQHVLPLLDSHSPKSTPIRRENGTLDIYSLVTTAVSYFNKNILRDAVIQSSKTVRSEKASERLHRNVPRESVYQSELSRILVLWLANIYGYEITIQWHLSYETAPDSAIQHEYCDIVVTSPSRHRQPMIFFDLLASGTRKELREHFERALEYATKLEASNYEVWVVNLTCLDGATQEPIWQSEEELDRGLNVVQVWHDLGFTEMKVSFRGRNEDDQVATVLDNPVELAPEC